MTMVKIHECYEDVKPLMEVLRDLQPDAILPDDDPRLPELEAIRDTALENDYMLIRLIELKPHCRDSYKQQWQVAEDELDRRVAKLDIKCL